MRFLLGLVGAIVLVGLQGALAPHLRLFGVTPDLPLAAVLVVGLRGGPGPGILWGGVIGALLDLGDGNHLGLFVLAAAAAGWIAGEAMLRIDPARVVLCWLLTALAAALYGCLVMVGALVVARAAVFVPGAMRHALAAAPYDGAVATVGYWLTSWVPRRSRQ